MVKVKHKTNSAFKSNKALGRRFLYAHGIILVVGCVFLIFSLLLRHFEEDSVGRFHLGVTTAVVHISWGLVVSLGVSGGLGFLAQTVWNRPCAWILYCGILGVSALVELALGGSAIGRASSVKTTIKHKLFHNMGEYRTDKNYNSTKHEQDVADKGRVNEVPWDQVQEHFKCCGLSNYKDWQDVQFGRTSLTVPMSCCRPSWRKKDRYCGVNILPEHPEANEIIYAGGCFDKLLNRMIITLTVLGSFSIIVAILQLGFVAVSTYLLIA